MLNHELMKEEIDLLQGRISKSVSVRHYWSLAIKELRDRVFRVLELLEPKLA
jgi:adenine specific DNA methylase Mod